MRVFYTIFLFALTWCLQAQDSQRFYRKVIEINRVGNPIQVTVQGFEGVNDRLEIQVFPLGTDKKIVRPILMKVDCTWFWLENSQMWYARLESENVEKEFNKLVKILQLEFL